MAISAKTVIAKPTIRVSVSESSDSEESDNDETTQIQTEENSDSEKSETEGFDNEEKPCTINDNSESGDADSESDQSEEGNSTLKSNEGWADSLAKILGSKKPKNKKTLVLSRAKKHNESVIKDVKEEKPSFEVIGESGEKEVKLEPKKEADATPPEAKKKKIDKTSIRVKPNILEKDRERLLSKIATKGVVQLFNAVRNQQKNLDSQIDQKDVSETKKEKILKKFDKRAFLDSLMGQTKSVVVDDNVSKLKDEVKDEDTPKWSALRDDFMTGAKMKDWDKESVDE